MFLPISKLGTLAATLLMLLFLGLTYSFQSRANRQSPYDVQLEAFPNAFGDWHGVESDALSLRSQDILRLDQYIRRVYTDSAGHQIFVYVGYWKKQSGEHQAAKHSPLMCLPANGWKISQPEPHLIALDSSGSSHTARQLAGTFKDESELIYYWFFSGEQTYLDETEALFHIMHETILHARSDGGIVELSMMLNRSLSQADAELETQGVLDNFVKDFYPLLSQAIMRPSASPPRQ